jgi:transposase
MAGRVRAREIDDDEGNRLMRIVRRGSGSVVTWRRAQMVLWSAQGMSVPQIAGLAFTSEDRVRDVLHNFNADGFDSLYPRYAGGRPPVFTLAQRREIKTIAKSKPAEHGLPFSRWSLAKLADFLVAEGVVEDISHEGLRELLRAEGVSFQAVKTWKQSADPEYAVKKARIGQLYAIADHETGPAPASTETGAEAAPGSAGAADGGSDPEAVFCLDEFGPLNLQPRPGHQWARRAGTPRDPGEPPRPRRRATYHRTGGVRHLFGALDLTTGRMYGHVKRHKKRAQFLEFCRYLRSLYPPQVRIAIICDNYSPHLTSRKDKRVGNWAMANNTEIAYLPTNSSWMNRIEAQFTALREFALNGTDHTTHREQNSMIRRYIAWRNRHTNDPRLRRIIDRANVA